VTLEIKKPELEALIEKLRESGADLDEVLFNSMVTKPFTRKSLTRCETGARRRCPHARSTQGGNRFLKG